MHTDTAATCIEGEWVCDGGEDFAVCTCGEISDEGATITGLRRQLRCRGIDFSILCVRASLVVFHHRGAYPTAPMGMTKQRRRNR